MIELFCRGVELAILARLAVFKETGVVITRRSPAIVSQAALHLDVFCHRLESTGAGHSQQIILQTDLTCHARDETTQSALDKALLLNEFALTHAFAAHTAFANVEGVDTETELELGGGFAVVRHNFRIRHSIYAQAALGSLEGIVTRLDASLGIGAVETLLATGISYVSDPEQIHPVSVPVKVFYTGVAPGSQLVLLLDGVDSQTVFTSIVPEYTFTVSAPGKYGSKLVTTGATIISPFTTIRI